MGKKELEDNNINRKKELIIIIILSTLLLIMFLILPIIILFIITGWFLYEYLYYKSEKFINIKNSIKDNTKECNELNEHIEKLKNSYIDIKKIDYGTAEYVDQSRYNFKRPALKNLREKENVYECSSSICKNAEQQPFKYICKYFNINLNEETLEKFENVLNDFAAAEQGKQLLKNERDKIINSLNLKIPLLIQKFSKKKLLKKLGFEEIDFSQLYFPRYTFRYISAGGNSSISCRIVLDIDNLNKFVKFISDTIKFKKSVAGQRALMTTELREKIKSRDCYTCKNCNLSTMIEPNLLLEIDHIIPLSKNGQTTEDNLQTLCWKCNRSKGSKIMEDQNEKVKL